MRNCDERCRHFTFRLWNSAYSKGVNSRPREWIIPETLFHCSVAVGINKFPASMSIFCKQLCFRGLKTQHDQIINFRKSKRFVNLFKILSSLLLNMTSRKSKQIKEPQPIQNKQCKIYTLLIQTVSYWTGWAWTDSRVQKFKSSLSSLPAGGHKSTSVWNSGGQEENSRLTGGKNIFKQSNNYYLWSVCTDCLIFNNRYDLKCIPSPFSRSPHTPQLKEIY